MASMYDTIAGEYCRGSNDQESRRSSLLAYTTSTRIRRYINRRENRPPISDLMKSLLRKNSATHEGQMGLKEEEKVLQGEIDNMSRFLYGILRHDDKILIVDDNEAVQDYHDKINQSVALEVYGQTKCSEGNYEEAKKAYRLAIRMEHAFFGPDTPTLASLKSNLRRIPGFEEDENENDLEAFEIDDGDIGPFASPKIKLSQIPFDKDHEKKSNHADIINCDPDLLENFQNISGRMPSDEKKEADDAEPLSTIKGILSRIPTKGDEEEENQIDRFDDEGVEPLLAKSRDVSFFSDSPPLLHSLTFSSTGSASTVSPRFSSVPQRYHPLIWLMIGFLLAHVPTLLSSFSIDSHGIKSKLNDVFIANPVTLPRGSHRRSKLWLDLLIHKLS